MICIKADNAQVRQSTHMSSALASSAEAASQPVPEQALLARYDFPGPRYTSYPAADRYTESYGAEHHLRALRSRALGGLLRPLSLYVHIPFCRSVCYYCSCNTAITRDSTRSARYLRALAAEARMVRVALASATPVVQLHLGGGTPTFLRDAELAELTATLRETFTFAPDADLSIEIDPRTVDAARLRALRDMGYNRISMGIQDFNRDVQAAVNRVQSEQRVFRIVRAAREYGYSAVSVDMIYGLPRQTTASFKRSLDTLIRLAPDRIAMYPYTHLPERYKPQRRIVAAELPALEARAALQHTAATRLVDAGWEHIGMDYFALPHDALAVARRQGRLHRNFQGYSALPPCDIIALGASSISRVSTHYAQNLRTLNEYYDSVENGQLPVFRGHAMNADDLVRHAVIMAITCQGAVRYSDLGEVHMIDFTQYFKDELEWLRELAQDGLVELEPDGFRLTQAGWFAVRAVAMVFDRYARDELTSADYAGVL